MHNAWRSIHPRGGLVGCTMQGAGGCLTVGFEGFDWYFLGDVRGAAMGLRG